MKIGLALSGGGIKGIAHISTLKAINEQGIKIDQISGTSAGAIVGALYAAGHSWEDILEFFTQTSVFDISKFAYGKPGFIDTIKFEKDLRHYLPDNSTRRAYTTDPRLISFPWCSHAHRDRWYFLL
jgi:NTE family protein